VVGIPNYISTTLGLNYGHTQWVALIGTTKNGIVLGGDFTIGTSGGTQMTEAEICWGCHTNATYQGAAIVTEWGANTHAATGNITYDFGTVTNANWTLATWSSAVQPLFAYKTGAIRSTHTANPSSLGGPTSSLIGSTGANTDTAAQIRCSYCHDVHGINLAVGDTMSSNPYLRGNWITNPYREDGAPQSGETFPRATSITYYVGVPRGLATSGTGVLSTFGKIGTYGGYWIDQNSGNPASAYASAAAFGGLCNLCHGDGTSGNAFPAASVDDLNQFETIGSGWISGYNGHQNMVKGASGVASVTTTERGARNIFDRRGGTTGNGYAPLMNYQGMTDPADNSPGGGFRDGSASPRYQPTFGQSGSSKWARNMWGVDARGATTQNLYHTFTCSKCHNPHASRLPKLMITNCLDTKHNTWDNTYQIATVAGLNNGRAISNWSSAQNCHRVGGDDPSDTRDVMATIGSKGWNSVTPW
jgi:hypothetical protein